MYFIKIGPNTCSFLVIFTTKQSISLLLSYVICFLLTMSYFY